MPKGIKKRAKIILIVAASLVILLASPIILLNISGVQRFVVNKVTNVLEQKLETHIEIGKVKYKLFNKLSLSEVLIEDQHSDTLLYANEVSASVSILPLFKRELRLNEGILSGVDMHIITYADGSNNIAFIAQAFKSTKQSDPFSFDLEIGRAHV